MAMPKDAKELLGEELLQKFAEAARKVAVEPTEAFIEGVESSLGKYTDARADYLYKLISGVPETVITKAEELVRKNSTPEKIEDIKRLHGLLGELIERLESEE